MKYCHEKGLKLYNLFLPFNSKLIHTTLKTLKKNRMASDIKLKATWNKTQNA